MVSVQHVRGGKACTPKGEKGEIMLKDKLDLLASARGFRVEKEMDYYTIVSKGGDFIAHIYEDGTINFYVKQEDDEGFFVLKSIDADELDELRRFCERLNKEEI